MSNCKYGVIVVSPNFFDREWTEKELKELLSRQSETGNKLILPIAYEIELSDIRKKYKKLSDIQFIDASKYSVQDITIQLAKIMLSEHLVKKDNEDNGIKYQFIKEYCEKKMCSSLDFFDWLSPLIHNNEFIEPYDKNWIGWDCYRYKGEIIPLLQERNGLYRINPQYYDDFKLYYEKEIKPQI